MNSKVKVISDAIITILHITKPVTKASNPKYEYVIPPLDGTDEDLARLIVTILAANRRITDDEASEIMNIIVNEIGSDRRLGYIPILGSGGNDRRDSAPRMVHSKT